MLYIKYILIINVIVFWQYPDQITNFVHLLYMTEALSVSDQMIYFKKFL